MNMRFDWVNSLWVLWFVLATVGAVIVMACDFEEQNAILSEDAIATVVTELGYTNLDDIELDDGTYDLEAVDAEGREVELEVDATTGEILELEFEYEDDEEGDD